MKEIMLLCLLLVTFFGSTSGSTNDFSIRAMGFNFDGCYNMFLDIGSNIGVHIRKLFEPELYPRSDIRRFFDEAYGSDLEIRRNHTCAFGIELNPSHSAHLKALAQCYSSQGWRTRILTGHAAGNSDEEYYLLDKTSGAEPKEWGARIGNLSRKDTPGAVPSIDLPRFIEHYICNRKVPAAPYPGAPPPMVQAKVDIEGAEYHLYLGMFVHRNFCCINRVTHELHRDFGEHHHFTYKYILASLMELAKQAVGCPPHLHSTGTQFFLLDDESYSDDGMPPPHGCSPFTFI